MDHEMVPGVDMFCNSQLTTDYTGNKTFVFISCLESSLTGESIYFVHVNFQSDWNISTIR